MLAAANTTAKMLFATHVPAVSTAAIVTLAATTGQAWVVRQVTFSYSAAPAAGSTLIITDGTSVYTVYIAAGGAGPIPLPDNGMQFTSGAAVTITLAASAGVFGAINAFYQ